jgi:hypothetical protein
LFKKASPPPVSLIVFYVLLISAPITRPVANQ